MQIFYKEVSYKYVLQRDVVWQLSTPIIELENGVKVEVIPNLVEYHSGGILVIKKGYAWNGGDFPAIDSKTMIAASLPHDVLCQMMNNEVISREKYWEFSKEEMLKMAKIKGMTAIRRSWINSSLNLFGKIAKAPKEITHVI